MEIQKNTSDGGEQGHSLLFSIMCSIFDKKSTVLSLGDEQGYSLLTWRPALTIGVSLERKITWVSTGENIF
jgi:hypothetical protein